MQSAFSERDFCSIRVLEPGTVTETEAGQWRAGGLEGWLELGCRATDRPAYVP